MYHKVAEYRKIVLVYHHIIVFFFLNPKPNQKAFLSIHHCTALYLLSNWMKIQPPDPLSVPSFVKTKYQLVINRHEVY
jgi:hypothetical protein